MIQPTVGRKVWYRPSEYDKSGPGGMTQYGGGQPLDATVIAVHGDRCVNLHIVDHMGKTHFRSSAKLLQEGDAVPIDAAGKHIGGYAEWMPYQQGQAKAAAGPQTGPQTPGPAMMASPGLVATGVTAGGGLVGIEKAKIAD